MKELRKILRELRVDHDLKQETVANYLGIEQQSYSNYENGNRGIPLWVVIKLSDYYKVSTDYLLVQIPTALAAPTCENHI